VSSSPAFGQADLTNCERELIHLAGSIQPHGLLLTLRAADGTIVQASRTAATLLRRPLDLLIGLPLAELGGTLAERVAAALAQAAPGEPWPLRCTVGRGRDERRFAGAAHAVSEALWVVELEPQMAATPEAVELPPATLEPALARAVQNISEATTLGGLADATVRHVRDLTGYDRVMVYRFDADGHGQIVAEARHPRLATLLGHHYPATDIPQRARDLYLRNRVRVLVDVDYEPSPLAPASLPAAAGVVDGQLDMSMCYLRSMSPLHLQYLRNMGVRATLVVSIVQEGQLWGLIACHHDSARNLGPALRMACDLLGEAVGTRIAAIENYARAQVAIQVRRLQQRLVEATATEGDWRQALLRNPRTLLRPLDASGVALFHGGEVLTCGEVPSTPELHALAEWVHAQAARPDPGRSPDSGIVCAVSSIGRAEPSLQSLTPTASGVLAVRLSATAADYIVWLRKEQLQTLTWAGDPNKPVVSNDPLTLSPRRSFAAWSEIVRGTATPWTAAERAMAAALGDALVDIVVQVNAVRLLIAEHQLAQVRRTVAASTEAVVVAGVEAGVFHANDAFARLAGREGAACRTLDTLLGWFTDPAAAAAVFEFVRRELRPWRGELALALPSGAPRAVACRAEPVPARDGALLGVIVILTDLTQTKRADEARVHLEDALSRTGHLLARGARAGGGGLVDAVIANASLAAMDISDAGAMPTTAPLLEEVERSATRAAQLCERIRDLARDE
jgi:light-regulated signal transduction histidine kinase (bacteriophytochrome)